MKPIHIYIETYKRAVIICAGSYKKFIKTVRKTYGKANAKEIERLYHYKPSYAGRTYFTVDGLGIVIHLEKPPRTPTAIAVMVHELSHATNEILRNAGMPLTEDSEEAYTYLLEHLTREALKATPPHFTK